MAEVGLVLGAVSGSLRYISHNGLLFQKAQPHTRYYPSKTDEHIFPHRDAKNQTSLSVAAG